MIEGLRAVPWIQHARARMRKGEDPQADSYLDCRSCMTTYSKHIRAEWGCGHLPAAARSKSVFPLECDFRPTICPGYSASLPQVREAASAYAWWDKGQLRDRLGGPPTEAMVTAIDILHGAVVAVQSHALKEASSGNP